jgi:hypothetical protein
MSHSLHLSAMINEETTLFKEAIGDFLETKIKELTAICKTNIEETIDAKLQGFYKKSSAVSYDDVLFDQDGTYILRICVENLKQEYKNDKQRYTSDTQYFINKQRTINNISVIEDKRCFVLSRPGNQYSRDVNTYYIYKTIIIHRIKNDTPHMVKDTFEAIEHTLSNDILFALKYLQFCDNNEPGLNIMALNNDHHNALNRVHSNNFMSQYKILKTHPEYFQQQCNEFELFCKKEYEEIKNTKEQLKATISLYEEKIAKYTNFEEAKEIFEENMSFYLIDATALEQKRKDLDIMNQTLHNEYHELELEKIELQKEKLKLKEETMKLQMEQRKLAKTQASLATIQLSIDDASQALDKEINDLTYAKFIFEKEKEEYQKSVANDN